MHIVRPANIENLRHLSLIECHASHVSGWFLNLSGSLHFLGLCHFRMIRKLMLHTVKPVLVACLPTTAWWVGPLGPPLLNLQKATPWAASIVIQVMQPLTKMISSPWPTMYGASQMHLPSWRQSSCALKVRHPPLPLWKRFCFDDWGNSFVLPSLPWNLKLLSTTPLVALAYLVM